MSIQEYLRELERRLRVGPMRRRRILRELEAHLLDSAAEEERTGLSRLEAERRAIERLGSVDDLVARFNTARRRRPSGRLIAVAAVVGFVTVALVLSAVLITGGTNHASNRLAAVVCRGENAKQATSKIARLIACADVVERCREGSLRATIWVARRRMPARIVCRNLQPG
jgi:hypothetical protein